MAIRHQRLLGLLVCLLGIGWLATCFWIPPLFFLYRWLYLPEFMLQSLLRIEFVAAIFLAATGVLILRSAGRTLRVRSVATTYLIATLTSVLVVALFWPTK